MRLPKIGMLVALPDLGMDDSLATGKGVPLCFLELKLTVSSDLKEIHPSPQIEGTNAIGGLAPLLSPDRLAPFRQEKGEPQLATRPIVELVLATLDLESMFLLYGAWPFWMSVVCSWAVHVTS